MIDAPKTTLFNNLDDLELEFFEGENELEFEIDDYSFVVSYSLDEDDSDVYSDYENDIVGGMKLTIISINAYDNIEEEDYNISIDADLQKLFVDYYNNNVEQTDFE